MKILTRKICGVYKITNLLNGKVYIGQSRHVFNRWAQHRHGRGKDHNYYLRNAITQYGIDNFSFEVLEECPINQLNELERKYITQYNSVKPNGYNLEMGGSQSKVVTSETKRRMSLAWLKRPPMTERERHNRSIAHRKPVSQYTLAGEYIRTYPSIQDAAKSIGFPESNIINCCKGKNRQKSVGGYQWRYASDAKGNIKPLSYRFGEGHRIRVSQHTLDGTHIRTYNSLQEAARAMGVDASNISNCITGKQKSSGGFVWRRAK